MPENNREPQNNREIAPPEELISAYLDGELTPAENARVERLLAEREDCRLLLSDLRELRAQLQAIPKGSAGGSFSRGVIARLKRSPLDEALSGNEGSESGGSEAGSRSRPMPPVSERSRSLADRWRMVLWPAIAIVVALMIYDQNQKVRQDNLDPGNAIARKADATSERDGVNNSTSIAASALPQDAGKKERRMEIRSAVTPGSLEKTGEVESSLMAEKGLPGTMNKVSAVDSLPLDLQHEVTLVTCDVAALNLETVSFLKMLQDRRIELVEPATSSEGEQTFFVISASKQEIDEIVSELARHKDRYLSVKVERNSPVSNVERQFQSQQIALKKSTARESLAAADNQKPAPEMKQGKLTLPRTSANRKQENTTQSFARQSQNSLSQNNLSQRAPGTRGMARQMTADQMNGLLQSRNSTTADSNVAVKGDENKNAAAVKPDASDKRPSAPSADETPETQAVIFLRQASAASPAKPQ